MDDFDAVVLYTELYRYVLNELRIFHRVRKKECGVVLCKNGPDCLIFTSLGRSACFLHSHTLDITGRDITHRQIQYWNREHKRVKHVRSGTRAENMAAVVRALKIYDPHMGPGCGECSRVNNCTLTLGPGHRWPVMNGHYRCWNHMSVWSMTGKYGKLTQRQMLHWRKHGTDIRYYDIGNGKPIHKFKPSIRTFRGYENRYQVKW